MNGNQQKAYVVFNKLFVNNMEDSSGIFIGNTQAIGWSSYSKTNQGFGSLSSSTLTNAVSFVQDADMVDMPVQDTRAITLAEAGSPAQSAIDFGSIHANVLMNGSAIDLGDNKQLGWRSSRKVNYGFGKALGRNQVSRVASLLQDDDGVDAPFRHAATITDCGRQAERNIRITQKPEEDG
ncbi:hypothetical protein J31TS4_14460 [Paenibacillus sp. J31TS4]|uniref:hypothetical protein n=1 Tax=Paenibacillus sp. J31TS4 TaxID=2807195 RepID=UPI001B0E718F|nr:hypothetical protein [Paenibacillus sp. J31TS4]GIP38166.1 hypothetical protein J31TS4_14460 [Paenibacillus sp. J31TS4]